MKRLLALIPLVLLTACGTTVTQTEVVVQHNYIVRTASEEQKRLPAQPAPIDVTTANQTHLAEWIVQTEKRMMDLESIIRRLIEFYERPVTQDEKQKVEGVKPPASPQPVRPPAARN